VEVLIIKENQMSKLLTKQQKGFEMRGEIRVDNRNRPCVFDVVSAHGITVEWSANYNEALAAHRQSKGSKIFEVNMTTGARTRRA